LPHQGLVAGAADAGQVDAFGALLPGVLQQFGVAGGGQDHLGQRRLVPVHDDVDLVRLDDAQVHL